MNAMHDDSPEPFESAQKLDILTDNESEDEAPAEELSESSASMDVASELVSLGQNDQKHNMLADYSQYQWLESMVALTEDFTIKEM